MLLCPFHIYFGLIFAFYRSNYKKKIMILLWAFTGKLGATSEKDAALHVQAQKYLQLLLTFDHDLYGLQTAV